MMQCSAFRLLC